MTVAVVAAAIIVAAPLAWGAGELHRRNCVLAKRTGCSLLPWENGRVTHREPNYFNGQGGGTYGAPGSNLYGAP